MYIGVASSVAVCDAMGAEGSSTRKSSGEDVLAGVIGALPLLPPLPGTNPYPFNQQLAAHAFPQDTTQRPTVPIVVLWLPRRARI